MNKLVKESLDEAFNAMNWIEKEIEDTMAAYGLSEAEIDMIMNDPDIPEKIHQMIQYNSN